MRIELLCPACGACNFDFNDYESVVLLAPNLALMQFGCSRCKIHLSATVKLNGEMQRMIQQKIDQCNSSSLTDPIKSNEQMLLKSNEQSSQPILTKKAVLSYASCLIVDGSDLEYGIVRPLRTAAAELKDELEFFRDQLDTIETVDQVIKEIDTGFSPKRRDV